MPIKRRQDCAKSFYRLLLTAWYNLLGTGPMVDNWHEAINVFRRGDKAIPAVLNRRSCGFTYHPCLSIDQLLEKEPADRSRCTLFLFASGTTCFSSFPPRFRLADLKLPQKVNHRIIKLINRRGISFVRIVNEEQRSRVKTTMCLFSGHFFWKDESYHEREILSLALVIYFLFLFLLDFVLLSILSMYH